MNKAFVKEPEQGDPRCPAPRGCGGPGVAVGRRTLDAQLARDVAATLGDGAYYCANPACDVAYFDAVEKTVTVDALRVVPYPKDPAGPICPCLGIGEAEIRAEATAGCRDRVREILAAADGPTARCLTASPTGRSCATEVRRLFMKFFDGP